MVSQGMWNGAEQPGLDDSMNLVALGNWSIEVLTMGRIKAALGITSL